MSQASTGLSPNSSIPISAAENYQLKWNSHVTNLNTSVSSLYKNEKYADIQLFTCSPDEGCFAIPAHKIILGTCSHYFASIFDNNPLPINAMLYIVLPPDLSRRAVLTLIQYMYTGEATVANDILNEVLKGGEILKIRGLCKVHSSNGGVNSEAFTKLPSDPTTTTTATNNNQLQQQQQQHPIMHSNYQQQSYKLIENISATASPLKSSSNKNKMTPRNSIDKKLTGNNNSNGTSILPESRTVMSQQQHHVLTTLEPNPPQNYAQQSITGNNNQQSTTIIVKKDMAIDPADPGGHIPEGFHGLISLKIAAAVKKAQQQNSCTLNKIPNSSSSSSTTSSAGDHQQRRDLYQQIDENLQYDGMSSPPAFKVYAGSASSEHHQHQQHQQQEDLLRYTEKKKRIAQNQKPSSSSGIRENSRGRDKIPQQIPEALSFLTIKEEPIEWADFDGNGIAGQLADNRTEIITVKPETLEDIEHSLSSEMNDKVYSPLTCEVCNLKFQVPAAWVRHIESHSEVNNALQNVPKKRRRADEEENSENINILTCELCENTPFTTAADWVRHVQNTHTETELAMSNNSILMKKTNVRQPKESPNERCSICKKMFPSYASMMIHKRTHSGHHVKRRRHNQMPSNENQDSDSVD